MRMRGFLWGKLKMLSRLPACIFCAEEIGDGHSVAQCRLAFEALCSGFDGAGLGDSIPETLLASSLRALLGTTTRSFEAQP